jgi:hypothetical protein
MNWNDYIDAYCERLLPGMLGEPLNAVSNLAFWVAAALVWRRLRADSGATGPRRDLHALLISLVLIGAGSLAFHTFATRWASALDVVFIAVYLHFYLAVYAHRALDLRWRFAWLGMPAFWLLSQGFSWLWQQVALLPGAAILSGAATGYAAAWSVLLLVVVHSAIKRLPSTGPLAAAAGCFALSLTLRQLDLPLCSQWPWGTHFAWHLLNAATLGLTSWAVLRLNAGASADSRKTGNSSRSR